MDDISSMTAYGTSSATIIVGLTLNEWAAIAGIIGVIATYGTNLYFKIKHNRDK